jgi:tripartite-type tricarboxylate transporter receptor subunit TctC
MRRYDSNLENGGIVLLKERMMSHDRLASGVVLALVLLMASSPTPAWPDQPVRIVVPFAAGGTTDVMARVLAEWLSPHLGQPVIIENVAGSGGNNGATLVAKSTPNGSTILMATPGPAAMKSSCTAECRLIRPLPSRRSFTLPRFQACS